MDKSQGFIDWLRKDLTHFVALIEEGSAAVGDPWQQGFSDHDLQLIVSKDVNSEMKAVFAYLREYPLGNECLVSMRLTEEFVVGDTINDISLKFRAKLLAGEDMIKAKAAPDRDKAVEIGRDGLKYLTKRLERRWLNLAQWTNEYAHKKNYPILKNFFMFYAAYHYGKTGHYPKTRQETAAQVADPKVKLLLEMTNHIAAASKADQKTAIENALELIPKLLEQ
jgi:hypothetical protein